MPLLFSYGTLRDPRVQQTTFGRVVASADDELVGYVLASVTVTDAAFVAASGKAVHANAAYTGRVDDRVRGAVLDLTEQEIECCDRYEAPAEYRRRLAPLGSGREAWVYVYSPAPSRHDAPFLLPGGRRRDPAVEAWLDGEPVELRACARRWFDVMRRCDPDVRELMHDGAPTACFRDAAFAYVATFRTHVNVGFFHGASLADPHGLLVGSGQRMRHVKLVPGTRCDDAALEALVHAAFRDVRERILGSARA